MARDLMKSSNPTFRSSAIRNMQTVTGETMTVKGAVNKTLVLFALLLITASWTWSQFDPAHPGAISAYLWGGVIVGLVLAFATIFKPNWAPFSAPLYAIAEGFAVGGISAFYNQLAHGVAVQAVALTFGVMLVMLGLYRSGVIKVTQKFRMGMSAAIGGVFLFYIATWVIGLFGVNTGHLFFGTNLSIGISLVIVAIAALSLVLDFDMIDRFSNAGAPKFMEWYSGFSLMVTLVWLYMEILRLLANAQR